MTTRHRKSPLLVRGKAAKSIILFYILIGLKAAAGYISSFQIEDAAPAVIAE
jgi:hypothetical protein